MTKINQKSAVYNAIITILTQAGVKFSDGMNAKTLLTKEMRSQVNDILESGFRKGEIELDKVYDDKTLREYVSGLQSNWLRKDTRLNGGSKYVAKNPGTRSGSGDEMIRELKKLLTLRSDPKERAEIQSFIDKRMAEIKPKVEINAAVLPEALRKFAA